MEHTEEFKEFFREKLLDGGVGDDYDCSKCVHNDTDMCPECSDYGDEFEPKPELVIEYYKKYPDMLPQGKE